MTDMTVEHAMQLADLLYSAGYDARNKERDYDPRGCGAWQDVVEALTALSVDAGRYRRLRAGDIDDIAVVRGLGTMDYGMSAVVGTYSEEIDGDDLDAAIGAIREKEEWR